MQCAYKYRRALLALGIILAFCHFAFALDPSLDLSQYAHTAWKIRDGFTKGTISAIGQTPDGYLWLGTELGLLRFDGVRAVPWQPPPGEQLPHSYIRSLLAARDGRLWIGTLEGLASWKDGKLTHYPELDGGDVDALVEDREGRVWAGGKKPPAGRLCAIHGGSAQCYGDDGKFGQWVESLYADSGGNLWVAATGLWRWKPGPPEHYPLPDPLVDTLQTLIGGDNGALLVATRGGIEQLVNGKPETYPLPGARRGINPKQLLRDRNGGLWIGTPSGLLHVHQGRTDLFAQSDGLSGDLVAGLFEDREGNIWVSTVDGLDRFRDFAVPTISVNQGLSNAIAWSVLAARDGSVWLANFDGLNRWKDGQITNYLTRSAQAQRSPEPMTGNAQPEHKLSGLAAASGPGSLRGLRGVTGSGVPDGVGPNFEDHQGRIWVSTRHGLGYIENGRFTLVSADIGQEVYAMAEDRAGDLCISDREHGLFHLHGGSVVERIPWANLGHKDWAIASISDPVEGGFWLGFREGGVEYFNDGQVRASYGASDGLGEGRVRGLRLDQDGTLWASTEGGLSRVKNGRVSTLSSRNGLPCDTVHWTVEDDAHSFWLYTACGLVRIARPELEAWAADPKRTIQATVFDSSDGVRSHGSLGGYGPHVAKTADGKIWFSPYDGMSVIDPRHLPFNNVPPPVHVEQITAGRKTYWQNLLGDAASQVRLPPRVRDLEIDYTALSLAAPEKVRFRYKLEGRDRDWQDAETWRQAYYTDLAPGDYHFHVAACNNNGVWNMAGDTLDFSIAPAYYQTLWFRLACAAAFLALLWGLYQFRLHQIELEFGMRLDERVGERTRIARELHDTLLQSFHGLMFRIQAARNMLPGRPEEAGQALDGVLTRAEEAIAESRNAIHDLRSDQAAESDLAYSWISEGCATNHDGSLAIEDAMSAQSALGSNEYDGGSPRIVGNSAALRLVIGMVRVVAPSSATVLINGETGTGKEVIAHAIHGASPRRHHRFAALNCAAIPAALLESELFGHERGAFTGAVAQNMGRFESADRGTLFLDEIGELPLDLQPKLLRVLQEKQIERLGGGRTLQIDVRVVAATNQDLWRMVQERKFRADLYYRLNVFPITLPPLRDRVEDIPALVEYFVQRFSREMGRRIETIPSEVMNVLKLYDWPGNIRELENVIKRAVIMSTGPTLRPMLGELKRLPGQTSPAAKRTLAEAERDHITEVLRDARWVLGGGNGAAARLGMPRTTLVYRMRKLGIAREQGSKSFRGRLSELPDSPAEFSPDQQDAQLDGSEGIIETAFSEVGAA